MSLPTFSLSPSILGKALRYSVMGSVCLASFLSFSVQPLVGKLLLPVQGGSASTWLGTMVYFQISLLLGYGWATWLLRRRPLIQVGATATLTLIAVVGSRLDWVPQSLWTGLGGIFFTLSLCSLPAMILLFSTGPLLHGWLARKGETVPYYLYALSNAGSLAAVILYPFTIERMAGLSDQVFFWHGFLWIFAGILGAAGYLFLVTVGPQETAAETSEKIPLPQLGAWFGLSALSCIGMLGATHLITAEIGSSPLAWVGPFGAFLLSFLVTFSGFWQPRYTLACLGWLAISLTGFMLTKGVSPSTVDGWAAFWLSSLTASGSFFINGLLHELRPQKRFALFYLVLAAGGVAGGLFTSFGVPFFFLRPSEVIVVSCVAIVCGLLRLVSRREVIPVVVVLVIVLAPVIGLVVTQTRAEKTDTVQVRRFRNLYGYSLLKTEEHGLVLSSETTTHGTQLITDATARRRPTLYYTESSGIGRLMTETQKKKPAIKTAVVGLGAGTLAAYARQTDVMDFWDIDPKAIGIAHDFFTFVSDSPGLINIAQADGRKALESSQTDYDLILIDAFSGDGVPAHLLTREALAIYSMRLRKRHGILAIHTSSRYSVLFPIIGATAHTLGWSSLQVTTDITQPGDAVDWDCTTSQYILVGPADQIRAAAGWLPAEEDDSRVTRSVITYDPLPPGRAVVWTDDRHAAIDALDIRRYLRGQ